MKNTVPIIVQTVAKHSYWVESILTGLRKSAEKSFYELDFIGRTDTLDRSDYAGHGSIIVIGYVVDWLYRTLDILLEKGFEPIVVNAGVSDTMLEKCSAVYFRLEESMKNAIEYLTSAGRKNICLFGVNNMSLADRIKEDTFLRVMSRDSEDPRELVIRGKNPLSEHVEEFFNCLEEREIDAVICPNDTINTLGMMFASAAVAIPRYFVIIYTGLQDNFFSNIIPLLVAPTGVFLIKQNIDQMPDALIEAAVIDGATDYTIIRKIVFPLVNPAIATVAITTFQAAWGATEASTLYIDNEALKTFPFYISSLTGSAGGIAGVGMAAAATLILFLPNLIIFIIMQSRVMNTMMHSGIK